MRHPQFSFLKGDAMAFTFAQLTDTHTYGSPPTIVFLGTQDIHDPVATAEKFKQLMEENGRRSDLHIYEGQKHGFWNERNPEYYFKTVVEMDRFLASLGYLTGEPTLTAPSSENDKSTHWNRRLII